MSRYQCQYGDCDRPATKAFVTKLGRFSSVMRWLYCSDCVRQVLAQSPELKPCEVNLEDEIVKDTEDVLEWNVEDI